MVKVRGRNNAIWMLGAVLGSLLVIHILWRHPTNGSIQVEEYFYTCRLEQRAKVPLDFGSTYLKPIPELQDLRNQSAVSVEKVRRMILENFSRKQNVRLDDVEDAIRKGRKGLRGLTEPNSCQKKSLKLLREDIGEQQDGVYTGHLSSLGYSAYFDGHSNGNSSALVKIIAAKSQRTALFCHVWFRSKKKEKRDLHIVHADVMNRTHLSRFVADHSSIIQCNISDAMEWSGLPGWVILSDHPCGSPLVILPVITLQRTFPPPRQMTLCLTTPLMSNQIPTHRFIEWIEVHRSFGVEHFTVYTHNIRSTLANYIEYYTKLGVLQVKKWSFSESMHHRSALLDDCLHLNQYQTKRLGFLEADEYMVPYSHRDITAMIEASPCRYSSNILLRSYSFTVDPQSESLVTLSNFKRLNISWPYRMYDKVLVRPSQYLDMDQVKPVCYLGSRYGRVHRYDIPRMEQKPLLGSMQQWNRLRKTQMYDQPSIDGLVEDFTLKYHEKKIREAIDKAVFNARSSSSYE